MPDFPGMKKIMAVLFAVPLGLFAAAGLSACSSGDGTNGPVGIFGDGNNDSQLSGTYMMTSNVDSSGYDQLHDQANIYSEYGGSTNGYYIEFTGSSCTLSMSVDAMNPGAVQNKTWTGTYQVTGNQITARFKNFTLSGTVDANKITLTEIDDDGGTADTMTFEKR